MKDISVNEKLKCALKEKGVLIACHRGAHGGNVIQNTINSMLCTFSSGGDIAEFDVVKSRDGAYYVFHDSEEASALGFMQNLNDLSSDEIENLRLINKYGCLTNQKIPKLTDLLRAVKNKGFVNMDRCWGKDFEYTKGALDIISEYEITGEVIFKSAPDEMILSGLQNYKNPVMYMSIVKSVEEIEKVLEYDINTVGFELIFETDNQLVNYIPELKKRGYFAWVNSINLNDKVTLCANHDDIGALLCSRADNWGWLYKKGFQVIQTDFPSELNNYLKTLQ